MSDATSDVEAAVPGVILQMADALVRKTLLWALAGILSLLVVIQGVLVWAVLDRRPVPIYVDGSTLLVPVNGKDLQHELRPCE